MGSQATVLSNELTMSAELRNLAQSPLMLNVMTLAYQDEDGDPALSAGNSARERLLDPYIRRMFDHRELRYAYEPRNTLSWLHWLAGQMVQRSHTFFLVERLQPDWLNSRRQLFLY